MASYLIPYVDPKRNDLEEDPLFSEYTYGDSGRRGKILKTRVSKGDYLFFHTTIQNMRYITAYYFVEEVMDINKAREDSTIVTKYNNPHLRSVQYHRDNEVIVFGNPIKSLILQIPLEINKALLRELNIPFNPSKNQTELAAISSRLRNWVRLDANQADLLRKKIDDLNQKSYLKRKLLSNDEIRQILERDIEQFIAENPTVLGKNMRFIDKQVVLRDGRRLDLLIQDKESKQKYIVEIKKGEIGPEVIKQIKAYIKVYQRDKGEGDMKGIVVCKGFLPHFEDEIINQAKREGLRIYIYGWMFALQRIPT